jgi:hypothetical protein
MGKLIKRFLSHREPKVIHFNHGSHFHLGYSIDPGFTNIFWVYKTAVVHISEMGIQIGCG